MHDEINFDTLEIYHSIVNVFNSGFSTQQISTETEISYTAVSELRNQKRSFNKASFDICKRLYNFAVNNNLTKSFIDEQNRKGHYNRITFAIPVKSIFVSFNNLLITSNLDKPVRTNAVIETVDGKFIDANNLGCQFHCGYNGTDPHNLVRFLDKYSIIPKNKLLEIICTNNNVKYIFATDTLCTNIDILSQTKKGIRYE